MAWTLDQAKIYLGIGDNTQDVAIQRTMDIVLATVEQFLARKLMDVDDEVVTFRQVASCNLFLPRYPIISVTDISTTSGSDTPNDLVVYPDEGLLWSATFWGQKSVVVTYSAGYDADGSDVGTAPQIPLDLDHVLWEAFMYLWSTVDPLTGGPSTDPVGEGDTKSVTVFDAFKIDYAVGATAEGGSETQRLNWDWLAPWEPVLSLYQSGYSGANVGVA